MLYFLHRSFMNAFDPSSSAAPLEGPKVGMPAALRSSARPATSGASGPITTSPTPLSLQKSITATWSSTLRSGTVVIFGSRLMPALPGAQYSVSQRRDCASFQAIECSRPPVPTTSTLTLSLPLSLLAAQRIGTLLADIDNLAARRPRGVETRRTASFRIDRGSRWAGPLARAVMAGRRCGVEVVAGCKRRLTARGDATAALIAALVLCG
mmetsp:Transcript_22236/g.39683  ORF Transcript_22236/g.39683 Transcript_22236/m.39683 type:complete len:210 (+) Transcript_22236:1016-1645(+)